MQCNSLQDEKHITWLAWILINPTLINWKGQAETKLNELYLKNPDRSLQILIFER